MIALEQQFHVISPDRETQSEQQDYDTHDWLHAILTRQHVSQAEAFVKNQPGDAFVGTGAFGYAMSGFIGLKRVSTLFRNVPEINSIEMSSFCRI